MSIIFLIGGLVVIILGANSLVTGASAVAKRLEISDLAIGLTIVAIGTSTPELTVSVISAIKGNTDIAIGNILGSNIVNILIILGISAIIYPLAVNKNTQYKEIPLVILAVALVGVSGNDVFLDKAQFNILSRIDGIVMLFFFIIFMYYTFQIAKVSEFDDVVKKPMALWKSAVMVILGITGLYFGGDYFVQGAVIVARYFGMSDSLIGLTIVAIGTSLPELATSVVAAYRKNSDIAVGNVVGSSIINVFLILGITAVIKPLPLSPSTNIDIMVAIAASLLLFLSTFIIHKKMISRSEGIIYLIGYCVYLTYLIWQG